MKTDSLQRMIDGIVTVRDRWKAFWRLWRLARKGDPGGWAAGECLRCLMHDWRWIRLAEAGIGDELLFVRLLPIPVRRQRLRRYLQNMATDAATFTPAYNQMVARELREQGTELTPDQVEETRRSAFAKIRDCMRQRGMRVPANDTEMGKLLRRVKPTSGKKGGAA